MSATDGSLMSDIQPHSPQFWHNVRRKKALRFVSLSTRPKGFHFSFSVQLFQKIAKISQLIFRAKKTFPTTRQPAPVKHPSTIQPPNSNHFLFLISHDPP